MERDQVTGYQDEVKKPSCYERAVKCECECENGIENCPVHSDVNGKPFHGGVCCKRFIECGLHDYKCGNADPANFNGQVYDPMLWRKATEATVRRNRAEALAAEAPKAASCVAFDMSEVA